MTANEIIEKYGYLVKNVTEQYKLDEDGEAELWLELCEQANRSNLPTHIYQCVSQALKRRAETLVSAEQPPILELPEYYDPIEDALDECFRCELAMALGKAMEQLTQRERQVLLMYYCEGMNLKECGKELGLSKERIRQILVKALQWLRHPARSKYLRNFLSWDGQVPMGEKITEPRRVWRYNYPAGSTEEALDVDVVSPVHVEPVLAYGLHLRVIGLSPVGNYAISVTGDGVNAYLRESDLAAVPLEQATIYKDRIWPTTLMYQLAWESKRACQT